MIGNIIKKARKNQKLSQKTARSDEEKAVSFFMIHFNGLQNRTAPCGDCIRFFSIRQAIDTQ